MPSTHSIASVTDAGFDMATSHVLSSGLDCAEMESRATLITSAAGPECAAGTYGVRGAMTNPPAASECMPCCVATSADFTVSLEQPPVVQSADTASADTMKGYIR